MSDYGFLLGGLMLETRLARISTIMYYDLMKYDLMLEDTLERSGILPASTAFCLHFSKTILPLINIKYHVHINQFSFVSIFFS